MSFSTEEILAGHRLIEFTPPYGGSSRRPLGTHLLSFAFRLGELAYRGHVEINNNHEASFSGVYHDLTGLVEARVTQFEEERTQYLQRFHECRRAHDKVKYDRSEVSIAFDRAEEWYAAT